MFRACHKLDVTLHNYVKLSLMASYSGTENGASSEYEEHLLLCKSTHPDVLEIAIRHKSYSTHLSLCPRYLPNIATKLVHGKLLLI